MRRIGIGLVKAMAYVLAITPFGLLYLQSDLFAFFLYHVVRYRRKVVRDNLSKSFPEKTPQEIKRIERRFYRNLCDLWVEGCKLMRMKPKDVMKRVAISNPEVIQDLYGKGKNVFAAIPHSGNWEWFGKTMVTLSPHRIVGIYKKVKNPYFDAFMRQLRLNHVEDRVELAESAVVLRVLARLNDQRVHALIVADQSPRGVDSDYWTDFLHRDTCWFYGLEKLAKRLDYAVVFVEMNRVGRGRYQVTFKTICDDPKQAEDGSIMEQYARLTEQQIQNNPDNWLWSHRRWKHSRQKEA